EGRMYLSPAITASFVGYVLELQRQYGELMTSSPRDLTSQEKEFLQCLAEGMRFTEIGERLKMTPRGVEKTKARIEQKLGTQNLSELIREAIRLGLISA
ncbi:MAG: response regulator transcription factor, partial [Bdellovibrionales bacterium]|nr:response regulator transcription factor [Bdellovibrionales bacterium]